MASLQESFGQTVTESLACGTPVVAFDGGGPTDMVRPGVTGWLAHVAMRNGAATRHRDRVGRRRGPRYNVRALAGGSRSRNTHSKCRRRRTLRLYER
jgi:glycosyltransferase involved in cell wall biosynthesis